MEYLRAVYTARVLNNAVFRVYDKFIRQRRAVKVRRRPLIF